MKTSNSYPHPHLSADQGACNNCYVSARALDGMRLALCLLAAAALVAAAGCGQSGPPRVPVYPVQGKVEIDGRPAAGALVILHPKENPSAAAALAHVNNDGTFTTTTYETGDGAAEGDFIVTVEWFKPVQRNDDYVMGPNLAPEKYRRPETSDLQVHVAAQPNELQPIKLRR